jgi:hypothetical protein
MGTYDELMKLDGAKKALKSKPEQSSPDGRAASIPQPESNVNEPSANPAKDGPPFKEAKAAKRQLQASKQARYHASAQAGYPDSTIEPIRKAVRFVGKDPFFGRFTPEEKGILADIAYTYKRTGVKTSENEIARIAVNFIVNDHKENGENSVLSRVLKALNT